ncbi:MauE/DoxX family redox-associated membrane protein [Flavobacterium anhuiense]|uniref:MauE/DoxX family redox-associated membrane protein n=1 Tax=Flavobacterium anhuiense TaxID=459526 RepID=UPI0013C462C1|nr:MauE/DoxX family redox-associated membrane protein [Flavobacterium anhuiense]
MGLSINIRFREYIVEVICLLYILLFVYAAVSKLLDFENFQVQLGQSPLLSAFAQWVAVLVPLVEILLVLLLSFQKSRKIGLLFSYALMVAFTAYIYIILNYSSFIPCSCGGILEKMGWRQHLLFNVSFILLGFLGILMLAEKKLNYIVILRLLLLTAIIAIGMYIAFRISEQIISYHNSFIRRFPPHPAEPKDTIDLEFPTYYFAGAGNGKIYLGNQRAVLQVSVLDTAGLQVSTYEMHLKKRDTLYKSLQLRVQSPYFFISDGTTPLLFRGLTRDWKAYSVAIKGRKFNQLSIIDFQTLAVRSRKAGSGENAISIFNLDSTSINNDSLLKKQIDGLFDTDGKLHYDQLTGRLLYCYKYRNGYLTFERDLSNAVQRTTIDTISKAQISVAYVKSRGELKFDKPPLTVNRTSFFYGGLLFVNSGLPGRFERLETWDDASIIDVYNVESGAYLLSFYIYDIGKKSIRQFFIYGSSLYSLNGSKLLRYKLTKEITKHFSKTKK